MPPKEHFVPKHLKLENSFSRSNALYNFDGLNISKHHGSYESDWHLHSFYEIELILCGEAEFTVDNHTLHLKMGGCVLFLPGSTEKLRLYDKSEILTLRFREDIVSSTLMNTLYNKSFISAELSDKLTKTIPEVISETLGSGCNKELLKPAMKGIAQYITALIIGTAAADCGNKTGEQVIDPIILKAIMHIRLNIAHEITLKSLAKRYGYTPNYFSTIFKKETGKSFSDYLKYERLRLSDILLKTSDLSVSEIAKQVGFSTTAYFCRVYKNEFGITPGQKRL